MPLEDPEFYRNRKIAKTNLKAVAGRGSENCVFSLSTRNNTSQQERQKCLSGQYQTAPEEEEESPELPETTWGREM